MGVRPIQLQHCSYMQETKGVNPSNDSFPEVKKSSCNKTKKDTHSVTKP